MSARILQGATELIQVYAIDSAGAALTGLTDLYVRIRRQSDGFYYDWADSTFKNSGWTTVNGILTEEDATREAGVYSRSFTAPSADEVYTIYPLQTPGTTAKGLGPDVLYVGAAGRNDVSLGAITGDTTSAANLKSQFDGSTGLTGATFPARQDALSSISITGSAINIVASGATLTTGSQVGTYTNTQALDGTTHQISDTAGTTEIYYEFQLSANGVPVSTGLTALLNGNNDTLGVYAYVWGSSSWQQVGTLAGDNGSTLHTYSFSLFTSHVGVGADVGKVRIRFYGTGLTSSTLRVDQILVSYAVVNRSTGYSLGAVWVNTTSGTAGTTPFTNGTADNPVSTLADALTIATALNLRKFELAPANTLTLAASCENYSINGIGGTLNLAGYSIGGSHFEQFDLVSGIALASNGKRPRFNECCIDGTTFPPAYFRLCGLMDTIVCSGSGYYDFVDCYEHETASSATINVNSTADVTIDVRRFAGNLIISGLVSTSRVDVSVSGGNLTLNGTGGTVNVSGVVDIFDLSGGALTISQDVALCRDAIRDTILSDATRFAGANINASISSRAVPGDLMGLSNSAITSAKFAADAIDSSALAASAVTEIQSGLATSSALSTAQGDVTTLLDRLTATRAGYLDNLTSLDATITSVKALLPAALVGGRIDASVGAMQTDVITSAALAASAVTEIQSGLSTSTDMATALADLTTLTGRLTSTRAGYLDNLTRLDAAISSVAAAVLDQTLTGHVTEGSLGEAVALMRSFAHTRLFNAVYSEGLLTSVTLKVYASAAAAALDTDGTHNNHIIACEGTSLVSATPGLPGSMYWRRLP